MQKNYHLFYTLLIIFSNYYINYVSPSITNENNLIDSVFQLGMGIIQKTITSNITSNISESCNQKLNETFLKNVSNSTSGDIETSKYYFRKFLVDSSKDENDLTTYENCLNIKNNSDIYPLFMIGILDYRDNLIERIIKDDEKKALYVYGICFIEGCNESDQQILTLFMLTQLGYISSMTSNETKENFDYI